jgi:hypothetical protein
MDLERLTTWQSRVARIGSLFCLVAFLALLDGFVAYIREPLNEFKVLPGDVIHINGPAPEEVQELTGLAYESSTPHLHLTFEALHRGYWLGSWTWRGMLTVAPEIDPGRHRLTVSPKDKTEEHPPQEFSIIVFPDPASYHQSSLSLIRHHFDLSPWQVLAVFLPLTVLAFAAVFLFSRRQEVLLAEKGQAEIYKVDIREGFYEVYFGLGTRHGMGPGTRLTVFNEYQQNIGTVEVVETSETDAMGVASVVQAIRPGYTVSRE